MCKNFRARVQDIALGQLGARPQNEFSDIKW